MSDDTEPNQAAHVILMRPAQADPSFRGDEFVRPLSARGRAAARAAADAIFGEGHHPGPLLVAPVLAARQTAEIMMVELRLRAAAYTLPTLIADNPDITGLARFLAGDADATAMQPAEWRYLPWRPF